MVIKMSLNENQKHDDLLKEAEKIIRENNLFDEEYYSKKYPQIAKKYDNLLKHYLTLGFKEGKNPSNVFDNDLYINAHEDVKKENLNPLVHYIIHYIAEDSNISKFPSINQIIKSSSKINNLNNKAINLSKKQEDTITDYSKNLNKQQDFIEKYKDIQNKNETLESKIKEINGKIKEIHDKNTSYLDKVTSKNEDTQKLVSNSPLAINPRKTQSELTKEDIEHAIRIIEDNHLFDAEYYNNQYPEVIESTGNLFEHYLEKGYKEGKNPSKYFNTNYYLEKYGDVKKSRMNPLIYYALYDITQDIKTCPNFTKNDILKAISIIKEYNLFDQEFYYKQCPKLKDNDIDSLEHYIYVGYNLNYNPSKNFNTLFYKQKYLNGEDINPLVDYVLNNLDNPEVETNIKMDNEKINKFISAIYDSNSFDDEYYKKQNPDVSGSIKELIKHYVLEGAYNGLNPNKIFDSEYYLEENPNIMLDGINPYYHYLTEGIKDNKLPKMSKAALDKKQEMEESYKDFIPQLENSQYFDEEYYLNKYDDVKYSLLNPAYHYLTRGYKEGKNPSRYFDNNFYRSKYPQVKKDDINPLYHFLTKGRNEGNISKLFLTCDDREYLENSIRKDAAAKEYKTFKGDCPLVSMLILNHDGEKHLRRLFKSIKENTDYPNYEIIVVDNCSKDSSIEILTSLSNDFPMKIIKNDINTEFTKSYNQAIKEASGDYYLFLDNDIEVLNGYLNHLMEIMLSYDNVGAVGSKLIYPDTTSSKYNGHKAFKIQHTGIKFKQKDGQILPYNVDNLKSYIYNENIIKEVPALAGSILLISKENFETVGGFDSRYNYGYEAVDLCLKLNKKGYHNYCNLNSVVFHYELGTSELLIDGLRKKRDKQNKYLFTQKWHKWLKKQILTDKINKGGIFTDKPLKIEFITSETGPNASINDYFVVLGMANSLNKLGYETKIVPFFKDRNASLDVASDVDVLVSMMNSYDIDKIRTDNKLLIKVAWIINWFEWWTDKPYFESYDIVFASNSKGINHIKANSGYEPILLPEATDTDMYNKEISGLEEYECDYCFAGNYWHDNPWENRYIVDSLDPDNLNYKFNLYGLKWDSLDKFDEYKKGKVQYKFMPKVYASTKIVLDDASDFTKTPSSVNSRVFDALACGKLVLSNGIIGIKELFGDKLPTFDSKESLTELLNMYLSNPQKREAKVEELRDIVLKQHTYTQRADKFIDVLKDYITSAKIILKIPVNEKDDKKNWGDYHFAIELQREFIKHGYYTKLQRHIRWTCDDDELYDVALVLRGLQEYTTKPIHYNIMWNISHPDLVSIGEYDSYDQIYIASNYWADLLKNILNADVEGLLQCTNNSHFCNKFEEKYDTQLLFVGNSRYVYRKVLRDLLPTNYKLDIYGSGWEGLLDEKYIVATHIPNKELYKAYSSADVLLNDHWDDMRQKGFISNRIFDAIACGTVVLTDHVKGIEKVFPEGAIVIYEDKYDIKDKIEEALEIGSVDPNLINEHTFRKRAEKIIADYENKNNME